MAIKSKKPELVPCPCTQGCERRTAFCHGDREYCPDYYEYWEKKQAVHKHKRQSELTDRYQADNALNHLIKKEKQKKCAGVYINRR